MTFIKNSLAVSFGVAALCLSAQAGAARALTDDATGLKMGTDQLALQSASHSRLIFAQQTKTTPLNSPFAKPKPDAATTSATSTTNAKGIGDVHLQSSTIGPANTKRNAPIEYDPNSSPLTPTKR